MHRRALPVFLSNKVNGMSHKDSKEIVANNDIPSLLLKEWSLVNKGSPLWAYILCKAVQGTEEKKLPKNHCLNSRSLVD